MAANVPAIRLDKWLWHARFFKTRTICTKLANSGSLRLNSKPVRRAAQLIQPGDTLTFARGREILLVRVLAIGTRRGPAAEAALLYQDLSDATATQKPAEPAGGETHGRPDKRDRKAIRAFKDQLAG